MVICNDDIDAALAGATDCLHSPDAGVDADQERDAHRPGALDRVRAHAVAFLETVRDVKVYLTARELNGLLEHDNRNGAVHVVVAVDKDLLSVFDSRAETADGLPHP